MFRQNRNTKLSLATEPQDPRKTGIARLVKLISILEGCSQSPSLGDYNCNTLPGSFLPGWEKTSLAMALRLLLLSTHQMEQCLTWTRVALITHYTGRGDEGMLIVGGHFGPLTNISTKDDFQNPPGGNKDIYPHATLDSGTNVNTYEADTILEQQGYVRLVNSGVTATPVSIAIAFLKAWIWSRPQGHELRDKQIALAVRAINIMRIEGTPQPNECLNIYENARTIRLHVNRNEVRKASHSIPSVGAFVCDGNAIDAASTVAPLQQQEKSHYVQSRCDSWGRAHPDWHC
eukprot:16122800-Heterocapsa_arctica.AAC.2